MKNLYKNKGFTLIEVLIAITIIIVIFAIVMPSVNSARKKGIDAGVISSLDNIRVPAYLAFKKIVIGDPRTQHYTTCPTTAFTAPQTLGLYYDPTVSSAIVQITPKVDQIDCDFTVSTYAIAVVLKGQSSTSGQKDVYCTDSEDNKVQSLLSHWSALSGDGAVYAVNRLTGLCSPAS
ncbi:prepilin-type N-terminal cleavage/methylation domain-containing protein [Candidatus Nomurabacteria bacterium]|nr:prepilin-type N-terminal cleavage/methylation domain-containing protein [Candidatus Nomurabacteria bacterium]